MTFFSAWHISCTCTGIGAGFWTILLPLVAQTELAFPPAIHRCRSCSAADSLPPIEIGPTFSTSWKAFLLTKFFCAKVTGSTILLGSPRMEPSYSSLKIIKNERVAFSRPSKAWDGVGDSPSFASGNFSPPFWLEEPHLLLVRDLLFGSRLLQLQTSFPLLPPLFLLMLVMLLLPGKYRKKMWSIKASEPWKGFVAFKSP